MSSPQKEKSKEEGMDQEVPMKPKRIQVPEQERKHRTAPVTVYLVILFAAAFAMLFLAYLIQARNEAAAAQTAVMASVWNQALSTSTGTIVGCPAALEVPLLSVAASFH